jgi:hypothetical protein
LEQVSKCLRLGGQPLNLDLGTFERYTRFVLFVFRMREGLAGGRECRPSALGQIARTFCMFLHAIDVVDARACPDRPKARFHLAKSLLRVPMLSQRSVARAFQARLSGVALGQCRRAPLKGSLALGKNSVEFGEPRFRPRELIRSFAIGRRERAPLLVETGQGGLRVLSKLLLAPLVLFRLANALAQTLRRFPRP